MTYKINHKNSTVAGTPPAAGDIDVGEIAINAADAELYTKDSAGNIKKFANTDTTESYGNADGVQFTQTGTGAVNRTVESKLQDVVSAKDFGAVGDGVADDTAAIQAAIVAARSSLKTLLILGGTYKITSSLTLTGQDWFIGCGKDKTIFNYTGSSSAIIASTWNGKIEGISILVSQSSANGIEVGNNSRNCLIDNVYLDATAVGATTTGAGFFLNAGTGFSGGLTIATSYALQFKYGVKMVGTNLGLDTWTTVSMYNLWLVGRSAGIISGSAGVYMDALTNGVGTCMYGGTIESFAAGVQVLGGGGYGGVFESDFEGNTVEYSVGNSFSGRVVNAITGNSIRKSTNSTANVWWQDKTKDGDPRYYEDYFAPKHVTYEGSGNVQEEVWHRNDSVIDGNVLLTHARKFAIGLGQTGFYGPSVHPNDHYIEVGGQKVTWGTAAPTTNTWKRGDIRYNLSAASAGYVGWVCTAAGTPGTWATFGLIT